MIHIKLQNALLVSEATKPMVATKSKPQTDEEQKLTSRQTCQKSTTF